MRFIRLHRALVLFLLALLVPRALRAQTLKSTDLLAGLKLPDYAVAGRWNRVAAGIESREGTAQVHSKLVLLTDVTGPYDFTVEFTVGENANVAQVLAHKGRGFVWNMGPKVSGFGRVNGRPAGRNRTSTNVTLTAGKHISLVQVRSDSVSAFLDGKLATKMETNYEEVSLAASWDLNKPGAIGISADGPILVTAASLVTSIPDSAPLTTSSGAARQGRAAAGARRGTIPEPTPEPIAAPAVEPTSLPAISPGYFGLAPLIADSSAQQPTDASTLRAQLNQFTADDQPGISKAVGILLDAANHPNPTADRLYKEMLDNLAPSTQPAVSRAGFDFQQARFAAWNELLAHMPEYYPESTATREFIRLKISPPDPVAAKPASFVAINLTDTPMNDVTLMVDLIHSRTAPAATTREIFFVERWNSNEPLQLPVSCAPNLESPALAENRFKKLDPGQSPLNSNSWLADVGGVVSARITVWCDQAHYVNQIEFPENATAVSKWELNLVYQSAAGYLRGPARGGSPASGGASLTRTPPFPPTGGTIPEDHAALAAARRIIEYAPPNSPAAVAAEEFVAAPTPATRQAVRQQVDELMAAMEIGTTRNGQWFMPPASADARLPEALIGASGRHQVGEKLGEANLTITARTADGSRITATWSPPGASPAAREEIFGFLTVDPQSNRVIVFLESAPASRRGRGSDSFPLTGNTRLKLIAQDGGLSGSIGIVGQSSQCPIRFGPATKTPAR